jgi:hypothetical protein
MLSVSILLLCYIWVVSRFWLSHVRALWTYWSMCPRGMVDHPLGICPRVVYSWVFRYIYLQFSEEPSDWFPEQFYQFAIPPAVEEWWWWFFIFTHGFDFFLKVKCLQLFGFVSGTSIWFYYQVVSFYNNTRQILLLLLCSTAWSQGWVFLHKFFNCSGLVLQFWDFLFM